MNFKSSLISLFLATTALSHAEKLGKIIVEGNRRIESQTITSYVPVRVGQQFSQNDVDQTLRDLFTTGYFNDVVVSKKGNKLIIHVDENPIINQVAFEGNGKLKDDQLTGEINLRPREVLSRTKIQEAQQRILEIYRRMGRFGAKVDPKIIKQPDNRVDLVFEIDEGNVTHVRKIIFVGNNTFSTSRLEEQLLTKREKWYRFFVSDDVYDPDRFIGDQQNLRQFYYDHGYPDFRIVNAVAELTPDKKDFYLTFTIDEGEKYSYASINVTSSIKDVPATELKDLIDLKTGETFSSKNIEKTVTELTNKLGSKGYAFVAVEPQMNKNREEKTVDLVFEIKEGPRVHIDEIEIRGNDRTHDHVIRREMRLHEGDAYNTSKIKDSEKRIKDLGFFKTATVESEQGDAPDRAKLVTTVEEQSTGELKLSGGYSTLDGPVGAFGISERNFRGTGKTIHADVSVAKKRQDLNLGIIDPYFLDRELEASADVYNVRSSRISAYTEQSTGIGLGIGYHLQENLTQSWNYSIHQDKISSIDQKASIHIRSQKKNTLTSALGQSLTYDRRNSKVDPTAGYITSLSLRYAGLGGNVNYLSHELSGTYYYAFNDDIVSALRASVGGVERTGKSLRVADCIMLGGDSLRGFEYGGVGPRDVSTNDPLGGRRFWKTTLETQFTLGLPSELGVKGALFTDVGNLWKSPVSGANVFDGKALRASVGVGLLWKSPFGPIRVDYAIPVRKHRNDRIQRLNIGFSSLF